MSALTGNARRWLIPTSAGVALVALTTIVVTQGALAPLDGWVIQLFSPVPRSGLVHGIATAFSLTASAAVGVAALMTLGLALALRRRALRPLMITSLATAALVASVYVGKWAVGRSRPPAAFPADPEPAFPSGHSATAVVVLGCALLLLGGGWSTRRRHIALVTLAGYAGAIGICRLYLGVHWFSDVLAGWLLGIAIVGGVASALNRCDPTPSPIDGGFQAPEGEHGVLPDAHLGTRSV
jgi:membrane-associated phospholipid phosphatase